MNVKIKSNVILKKKKLFINAKQIEEKLKLSITRIKSYLSEIKVHILQNIQKEAIFQKEI